MTSRGSGSSRTSSRVSQVVKFHFFAKTSTPAPVAGVASAVDARALGARAASAMAPGRITSVWVINKSGGLIYHRAFDAVDGRGETHAMRLDANATLRLASVWHSMHAIARKVSPTRGCVGIESVECDTFDLYCFQAETGTKIVMTTTKGTVDARGTLRRAHQAFYAYALQNPFYEMEMPVRCELFDAEIANVVRSVNERT